MKKLLIIIAIVTAVAGVMLLLKSGDTKKDLPVVAIANYGQIPPLLVSIEGIKKELAEHGYVENKNIRYEIADIAFDHSLISQMITNLKNHNPKVMVLMGTPISLFAKGKIRDIPLVYNVVTDPVDAKLVKDKTKSIDNIVGSSDMQSLNALLSFVKSILPEAKTVELLYAISDINDLTLVNMMREEAAAFGMTVIAVPVEQMRDVPIRMQQLKGKVDFIYVGASGLQSALPTISGEAQKMNIPIFNIEEQSVRDGLALASFGVSYEAVGRNAGKLVIQLLKGADIKTLTPIYPKLEDHKCFINKKLAEKFGITIPKNVIVVE